MPTIVGLGQLVNQVHIDAKTVFPTLDKVKPPETSLRTFDLDRPLQKREAEACVGKDNAGPPAGTAADEHLGYARSTWEETVMATKQRFREHPGAGAAVGRNYKPDTQRKPSAVRGPTCLIVSACGTA